MNDEILMVPYIMHESEMARSERMIKRLFIALIISILFVFASSAAWLYVFNQYEFVSDETSVDMETGDYGNANFIGRDGDIHNGED